jgi:hypothetical protein
MRKVKAYLGQSNYIIDEELMGLKQMREQHLTINEIVDWMLKGHIHFIITHPHQGMESTSGLSVKEIYDEFSRLKYHPGFPSGSKLDCPIFTQDKWNYLRHVPSILPTCKILIDEPKEGADIVSSNIDEPKEGADIVSSNNVEIRFPEVFAQISRLLYFLVWYICIYALLICMPYCTNQCLCGMFFINDHRFMEQFPSDTEFVMKAPFITNRQHFHQYVANPEAALKYFASVQKHMFGDGKTNASCFIVPYIMLQVSDQM